MPLTSLKRHREDGCCRIKKQQLLCQLMGFRAGVIPMRYAIRRIDVIWVKINSVQAADSHFTRVQ